jgi:hypothetical protein
MILSKDVIVSLMPEKDQHQETSPTQDTVQSSAGLVDALSNNYFPHYQELAVRRIPTQSTHSLKSPITEAQVGNAIKLFSEALTYYIDECVRPYTVQNLIIFMSQIAKALRFRDQLVEECNRAVIVDFINWTARVLGENSVLNTWDLDDS